MTEDASKPPARSRANVELERVRSKVRRALFDRGSPVRLGRYELQARLGSGAMGIVYAGFDADLGRRVALKVLEPSVDQGPRADEQRQRLRREAKALARLAHPNIVTIFEVGSRGEQVFIAMELVEGQTLREWLGARKRTTGEIVEMLVPAGRGLAAAHAQGLVHRDFKPENVLIGDDGRPRIVDFGLVRLAEETGPDEPSSTNADDSSPGLTRTDVGMGTPLYMAPEQYDGADVDARADQFAFCAVLHEASFGTPPFAGTTLSELRNNVLEGRLEPPRRNVGGDSKLRNTIRRGLEADPANRFESMEALLAALEGSLQRRQGAVVLAIAGLAAMGALLGSRWLADPVCGTADEEIGEVWNAELSNQVRAAFDDTAVSHARDASERFGSLMDERARSWADMHTDACEATHVRGSQSSQLLDLRMLCLERRRQELGAVAQNALATRDGGGIEGALRAARTLTPLDRCADVERLTRTQPLPDDPEARERIRDLAVRLERARVARDETRERIVSAEALVAEARTLEYGPLIAETLMHLALAQRIGGQMKKAEATGYEVTRVAAETKHDEMAAYAWVHLVYTVGSLLERHDEALALRPAAEAAVVRHGNDPQMKARLLNNLGLLRERRGELDEAVKLYEECRRVTVEAFGERHGNLVPIHNNLGSAKGRSGRYGEATAHHEQALKISREIFEDWETNVVGTLDDLGVALARQGRLKEARRHLARAIELRAATHGSRHWETQKVHLDLGDVLRRQGDLSSARQQLKTALAIYEEAFPGEQPRRAIALERWAALSIDLGQLDEAERALREGREIRRAALGDRHPSLVTTERLLGKVALERKRWEDSTRHCEAALALGAERWGDHPELGHVLICLARAQLNQADPKAAAESAQRALDTWRDEPVGDAAPKLARELLAEARSQLASK